MEGSLTKKYRNRNRRSLRTRRRLRNPDRVRLCVIKTNNHIHVQLIDDNKQETVASTSTISTDFRKTEFGRKNKDSGKQLGLKIAALALQKDIKQVAFDRGSFKYHGVIAAVAEGAREGGLEL